MFLKLTNADRPIKPNFSMVSKYKASGIDFTSKKNVSGMRKLPM